MERKKVLIVDDEENICIFLKDIFERNGFEAYTATSGQDAVAIFNKDRPHVCIIDIHMPFSEFDGIETLRRVKAIDKKTFCAMVTRIDDPDKIAAAAEAGADEYLVKPVRMEKLKELIEKLK
jgi:DNA-binding response OmpR family regulator